MENKKILVVGGSGFIGRTLCKYFSERNELFAGTYCNSPKEGLIYFDLRNPDLNKIGGLDKVSHAIICSAVTHSDACKKDEAETYKINVEGTQGLLRQFFERKIFPIWFSSEYVFDGKLGNYSESSERNPNTVYGNYKKIIEDFLLNSHGPFLISRLGKVFGLDFRDKTFITSIVEQLQNNEVLHCAEDQIFSPTYVKDLAEILNLSITNGLTGLYNMASPEDFSRFQIAKMIKSKLKIETGKIIPCSLLDFKFLEIRPLNTSLNSDRIIQETGFKFTTLEDCISKIEKNPFLKEVV